MTSYNTYNTEVPQTYCVILPDVPYLFPLLEICYHDDGGRVLLPDHPPEVV